MFSVKLSRQSFIVFGVTGEACLTQLVCLISPSFHSRGGWPWTHSASSSSPSRWRVSSSSSGSSIKAALGCPRTSAPASWASATSRRWNGTQGEPRRALWPHGVWVAMPKPHPTRAAIRQGLLLHPVLDWSSCRIGWVGPDSNYEPVKRRGGADV